MHARGWVVACLSVALVATLGLLAWRTLAASPGSGRFDTCRFEGDTLVLTWIGGANQRVSASVDTRDGIVIGLDQQEGRGPTPAIGLEGEARFPIFGGPSEVRYADGEILECPRSGR